MTLIELVKHSSMIDCVALVIGTGAGLESGMKCVLWCLFYKAELLSWHVKSHMLGHANSEWMHTHTHLAEVVQLLVALVVFAVHVRDLIMQLFAHDHGATSDGRTRDELAAVAIIDVAEAGKSLSRLSVLNTSSFVARLRFLIARSVGI